MHENPFSVKTESISKIPAREVNRAGVLIERSIDGSLGGLYEPTDVVTINGEGISTDTYLYTGVTAVATLAGTTALTGSTSIASATAVTMAGTARVGLTSRSITRICDLSTPFFEDPSHWTFLGVLRAQNSTLAAAETIPIHVPHGATLTKVEVQLDNPSHGGSWPPLNPTRLELWKVDSTGSVQVGSSHPDSTAVQATYESRHWATTSALSIVMNRAAETYQIRVVCESGTDALTGVTVDGVARVTYTTAAYDED